MTANAIDKTEYIYRGHYVAARRHESSSRVFKYFTSERSEPTTALNLHWSDKGYIYYVTMLTLNFLFSRVKKIASFHARAHLVRYFIGVSIINHISFLFDQPLSVRLCLTRMTVVV